MLKNTRDEFESLRNVLWTQLEAKCCNCGIEKGNLNLHHIIPLATGGTNNISNIAVLCENCHFILHGLSGTVTHGSLVKEGKKKAKSEGRWSTGKIIYGYKKGGKKGKVLIHKEEAQVVEWMYQLRYEKKLSTNQILELLLAMAIPTKIKGNWSYSRLSNILETNVYFGDEHHGVCFPRILDESLRVAREEFKQKYYDYEKKRYNFKSKNELVFGKGIRFLKNTKHPTLAKPGGRKKKNTTKKKTTSK